MPEQQCNAHHNRHDQPENGFIPKTPTAMRENVGKVPPERTSSIGPTSPQLTSNHDHSLEATASAPMKSTTPMVIGEEVIERQQPSLTLLPITVKAPVGGGTSHSLDTSSGFPGAFHRSSFASFSERLARISSPQQQQTGNNENRKQDIQCHSDSKQQTRVAIGGEPLLESKGISDINDRRISAMSASEILEAQEEIRNSFPATLLESLKCRNQQQNRLQHNNSCEDDVKAQQRLSSISLMSDTSTVNTDADCGTTGVIIADKGELPLSVNDAPRTETEFEAFVQRWLPKEERSKLEWTLDPEDELEGLQKTEEYQELVNIENVIEPRVEFDGKIIPSGTNTPYYLGLHHHGQDVKSAGYTIKELVHLSRSTIHSQRILALRALVGVLRERRISLDQGESPLHDRLSNDVLPVLRMALDGEGRVLELGLQGLLFFTVHPSNELTWFSRTGISLDGHVPILPTIRPMCTADEYHEDEANKREKVAEYKGKDVKDEGYGDVDRYSWLSDSCTPGRMCADPIRGGIVASGALPRGLSGAARVAAYADLLEALKGQILYLNQKQYTVIGPPLHSSSVNVTSKDMTTWDPQYDSRAGTNHSDIDDYGIIIVIWVTCLIRAMTEGGREVAEHLCVKGLGIAIRSMVITGLHWKNGQERLQKAIRMCSFNAWKSFLCYGFELEGLGQVMAALSDSGHRCGGSGEVFTTSDAQHPMVQRLLEDSCLWASMPHIPKDVTYYTYICLSKAVASCRKEEERTLIPVLCQIWRGVIAWLTSVFKHETKSHYPAAARPQVASALYLVSQMVIFFGSKNTVAAGDFPDLYKWVVKHTYSMKEDHVCSTTIVGIVNEEPIPLLSSATFTTTSTPCDWMCSVLYLLLALHKNRHTTEITTITALETQAIVAWVSMAKAAYKMVVAEDEEAFCSNSNQGRQQRQPPLSAPYCSIVMCHYLVSRVLHCVVLSSWPMVVPGIHDALIYPCAVLSLMHEYGLEEVYSFAIVELVEDIIFLGGSEPNRRVIKEEYNYDKDHENERRSYFVRVIEDRLGGNFAVYQSKLACTGLSPYELRSLSPTCYHRCNLPRDWLLLPMWEAMVLNNQERTTTTTGALMTCLCMIMDLYGEDSELMPVFFFTCATTMTAALRKLAARPVPTLLSLLNIARMDIVLDEWCTDHYEYILYAVLRHCGRASRGWGEVLATEAAAVNSQVNGRVMVVPDSGQRKDEMLPGIKELENIAKDLCNRFLEGAVYDGFVVPALLVLLRPDIPPRVRATVWSEIGRVGLLHLIGAAEPDDHHIQIEKYYDCKPGSVMLDAYTEALQHHRFLDDRETLLFKIACHGLSHHILSGVEGSPELKWGQKRRLKKLPVVAKQNVLSLARCMVENGHVTRHAHVGARLQDLESMI